MPNKAYCSDGTWFYQSTIDNRYKRAKEKKWEGVDYAPMCEACAKERGCENDHTIAQARCKKIKKTELIWFIPNFVWSCRKCHKEWENFKSGEWLNHLNCTERLAFMKEHDPEGYRIRVNLTQAALEEAAAKENLKSLL